MTSVEEVIEFLGIAGDKGFLNDNTVVARRTACNKFFDILEPDQKTVEYVRDNLDVVKARFSNLNKDVRGNTVDEYARRVKLVLDDFTAWKTDRSAWEREVSARQSSRPAADGQRKAKSKPKAEKAKVQETPRASNAAADGGITGGDTVMRLVEFPLRRDVDVKISLPRDGITMAELKKLAWFLLPYASDFDPEVSARDTFHMLERSVVHAQA